jgi:SynChlorMet cassette protein ScmC
MSTVELSTWAEKLASAMQLEMCEPDGYVCLVFISEQRQKYLSSEPVLCLTDNSGKAFSIGDWECQDIGDIRFWSKAGEADVICQVERANEKLGLTIMRDSLYPIYQRAQESGGLALHAALVELGEHGLLLAGAAGTGKSTCCHRIPKPWNILCDEECLVVQNGEVKNMVHPFPTWSDWRKQIPGRTWNVQRSVPLSTIFFIEQAEMDEVVPMGQGEAAAHIYDSATQVLRRIHFYLHLEKVKSLRKQVFENSCELARSVPAFKLRVSLNGRFWEKIEEVLP